LVLKHLDDETVKHDERQRLWEETSKLDLSFHEEWSGSGNWK